MESAPWLFHISLHLKILENPELIIAMTITSILITFTFILLHLKILENPGLIIKMKISSIFTFITFTFMSYHLKIMEDPEVIVLMMVTSYLDSDDDEVNKNGGCGRIRRVETF